LVEAAEARMADRITSTLAPAMGWICGSAKSRSVRTKAHGGNDQQRYPDKD
jgi:hypothetical protein